MLQLASCCYWRVGTAADRLAVDVLGCMGVAAGRLANAAEQRLGTAAGRLAAAAVLRVDAEARRLAAAAAAERHVDATAGRLSAAAEQRVGAAAGRLVVWVRPSAVWQASSAAIWPAGRLRAASVFTRILYLLQHYYNCISACCMDSARTAVGRA